MNCIILESANESAITGVKTLENGHGTEFTAILQKADYKNRNGRIYPKDVLDEAINSPLVQEKLRTHTLYGEAGHPLSTDVRRTTTIDLRNVAFLIEQMWWDGPMLKAKCKTASTAAGRDMAGLIEDGSVLSFSLRAQGNVLKDGMRDALVVQKPLAIIGWDWVWLPSNQDAYMTSDVSGISETTQEMMYGYSSYDSRKTALTESMSLYSDGTIIETNGNLREDDTLVDYFSNYGKNIKTLEEMYLYDESDEVKSINPKFVMLESKTDKIKKKVATKDYLTKSIQEALEGIGEDIAVGNLGNALSMPDEKKNEQGVVTGKPEAPVNDIPQMLAKVGATKMEAATEPANGNAKMLSDAGVSSKGDDDGVAVPANDAAKTVVQETKSGI